jgi:hypothetical protein
LGLANLTFQKMMSSRLDYVHLNGVDLVMAVSWAPMTVDVGVLAWVLARMDYYLDEVGLTNVNLA